MNIETKFNTGDKVWVIDFERIDIGCDICNPKGEIKIKGKSFTCPNCDGTRQVYIHEYKIKGVYEIKGIYVFFETKNIEKFKTIKYYMNIDDSDNLSEVYETKCFTTKKEAQAECDKRNKLKM